MSTANIPKLRGFFKGMTPWNKGKKGVMPTPWNKDTHITNSGSFKKGHKTWLGKRHTLESRKKMSNSAKGKVISQSQRDKLRLANLGKKQSEELKIKRGIYVRGEAHPNWLGGLSKNPYPKEFNAELKSKIRTRDNFICQLCGMLESEQVEELGMVLSINHIDYDKNNCREDNLITLCLRCNVKVNRSREYWTDYFRKKLICR